MSWTKTTCYPRYADEWSPSNPALGQCAVTALVIQDYLGGELLYCRHNHHYWNRLPSQEEIDLTRSRFSLGTVICLDEVLDRRYVLESEGGRNARTPQRYELLKHHVERKLDSKKCS